MEQHSRREFLQKLATATGSVVLLPAVTACGNSETHPVLADTSSGAESALAEVPLSKPGDWDAITFNKLRGNQGAIPASYLASINGAEGREKHLGKHLPYFPNVEAALIPAGFIALMWGDPEKGFAKHPNAPRNESNKQQGHWYNWIRIRKALPTESEELESAYSDWPSTKEGDNGAYAVSGGTDISADNGKNTVYLAALPKGLASGDTIRVYAHCLTHGEYVDFLTLP